MQHAAARHCETQIGGKRSTFVLGLAPAASAINMRSMKTSTACESICKSVRQYPQRDAREVFFRPRTNSQNERMYVQCTIN